MWRVYIKDDRGVLMRLPKKFLAHEGSFKLPQFAGTVQQTITVEWEGNMLLRISGGYMEFDHEGVRDVRASAGAAVYYMEAAELEGRVRRMRVPDLTTARKARDLRKQVSWKPSDEDYALIAGDTVKAPRQPIPIVRLAVR
jgi:hypothetical protein